MCQDLLQVRTPVVNFYVLRDSNGLYLVDSGFIGGRASLRRALQNRGWGSLPILGIIATHGHLDHIFNIGRISEETGAWIAAPRLDAPHYAGRPRYSGAARIAGIGEAIGRPLLRFRPFTPERLLDDGDMLDLWHGLTVVHLPGHTEGHSGLYCEELKLLFCGDLFASFGCFSHLPPRIFNSDGSQIPKSLSRVLSLELEGVLPSHADRASPEIHLKRLMQLVKIDNRQTSGGYSDP